MCLYVCKEVRVCLCMCREVSGILEFFPAKKLYRRKKKLLTEQLRRLLETALYRGARPALGSASPLTWPGA